MPLHLFLPDRLSRYDNFTPNVPSHIAGAIIPFTTAPQHTNSCLGPTTDDIMTQSRMIPVTIVMLPLIFF